MNYTLFYSDKCPDTHSFKEALNELGVDFKEININESMKNLKQFLNIRDNEEVFNAVKEENRVGVPVLMDEDNHYLFTIKELKKVFTD